MIAPTAPMPTAEFADTIVEHFRVTGHVRDTLKLVRRVLGILEKDLGVKTVAELERPDIDDIARRFDQRNAGLSPYTRASRLRILCRVIRVGHAAGLLRTLPRLPKPPQSDELPPGKRTQAPPAEAVGRLMVQLAADKSWLGRRQHALTSLVYLAKIPLEVATRIKIADVNLEKKTILTRRRYRGKSLDEVEPREVGISDDLVKILAVWIQQAGCEWLIPGSRREGPWNSRGTGLGSPMDRLRRACKAAGIQPITFEQLRRFHAETARPSLPFATFSARVILTGPSTPPIVNERPQPVLTRAQYNVIKALWGAAPGRLSKRELIDRSGHTDAVNILKAVRAFNDDWRSVIDLPGEPGKGYGLLV